jgi:UPF0716 protein FxsA
MNIGLFALLAVLPLLEIGLLIKLGQWFGFWWTLAFVIATAIGGTALLHTQGFQVMRRSAEALAAGKPPVGPVIDGAFLMLAGLLLITPGVITDIAGLLLLVPGIRHAVAAWSVRKALRAGRVHVDVVHRQREARGETNGPGTAWRRAEPRRGPLEDGPVIDGEFERIDERTIDPNRPRGPSGRQANGDDRHRSR